MTAPRTIRTLTIAVWALVAVLLVGLAFVSAQAPQGASLPITGPLVPGGTAPPVVYEFSTDS